MLCTLKKLWNGAWLCLFILFGATTTGSENRLSEKTYRGLTAIHELMAEERYDEALERLHVLEPSVSRKPYEHAVILQTYGHLYLARRQYAPAIEHLEKALATGMLPRSVNRDIYFLLAQLYLAQVDHAAAATNIEAWMKITRKKTAESHALAGVIYAHGGRHTEAVEQFEKAIAATGKPREAWFRNLLAMYYELGLYAQAARALERMASLFPNHPTYWLDLSNTYRAMGNEQKGLAAMETAYRLGLLSSETEILNLARLYLHLRVPTKAAEILETGLADGVINATEENWRLLGDAWLLAKELAPALKALERAAALSSGGQIHLQRARLLAEAQEWNGTLQAARAALDTGGLDTPGQAYLLTGIARYETGDQGAALAAFKRAADYPETRRQASHWLARLRHKPHTLTNQPHR